MSKCPDLDIHFPIHLHGGTETSSLYVAFTCSMRKFANTLSSIFWFVFFSRSLTHSTGHSWVRASWYNYEHNQRDIIMNTTNEMQLYRLIYYSWSALHVSGDVFAHHQEYLTVFTASGNIHQCRCRPVSGMRWKAFPTHPWQQPAAALVNITRYCKYSQVLLMMSENIARNM